VQRHVVAVILSVTTIAICACGDNGNTTRDATHTALNPDPPPRSSSLRSCLDVCDYDEACDRTIFDLNCPQPPCGGGEQVGDDRCHRVCEDDDVCAPNEQCVSRPIIVSDTPTVFLRFCLCSDGTCSVPRFPANEGGIEDFRTETPLPEDLYYHASATSSRWLFVSGGLTIVHLDAGSATLAEVDRIFAAPLDDRGALGAWTDVGALPNVVTNHAMAVVGDRLYVVGGEPKRIGANSDSASAGVLSAPIDDTGHLGTFRDETSLPGPRAWHTVLVNKSQLIVVGGTLDAQSFTLGTDQIWIANVQADGSLGPFRVITAPQPLFYDGGSAIVGKRLYVVTESGEIYSTRAASIGRWRREQQRPRWTDSVAGALDDNTAIRAIGFGDILMYVLRGGRTTSAPVDSNGRLGRFRAAARLTGFGSGFSVAAVDDRRAYVSGGFSEFGIARINAVSSTARH
jgi:hypothetical protein